MISNNFIFHFIGTLRPNCVLLNKTISSAYARQLMMVPFGKTPKSGSRAEMAQSMTALKIGPRCVHVFNAIDRKWLI